MQVSPVLNVVCQHGMRADLCSMCHLFVKAVSDDSLNRHARRRAKREIDKLEKRFEKAKRWSNGREHNT